MTTPHLPLPFLFVVTSFAVSRPIAAKAEHRSVRLKSIEETTSKSTDGQTDGSADGQTDDQTSSSEATGGGVNNSNFGNNNYSNAVPPLFRRDVVHFSQSGDRQECRILPPNPAPAFARMSAVTAPPVVAFAAAAADAAPPVGVASAPPIAITAATPTKSRVTSNGVGTRGYDQETTRMNGDALFYATANANANANASFNANDNAKANNAQVNVKPNAKPNAKTNNATKGKTNAKLNCACAKRDSPTNSPFRQRAEYDNQINDSKEAGEYEIIRQLA